MSYFSRLYNHRNAQSPEMKSEKPFFSKKHSDKSSSKSAFFQAKLSVNQPGDSYEHEADSVANAVVNRSAKKQVVQQNKISSIQRLATTPEEEKVSTNDERMERDKEKPYQLQTKSKGEEKMKEEEKMKKSTPVQKKQDGNAATASQHISSKIESSGGKGNKLPSKTLHEMNSSFGADFNNVHIHSDSESAEMNKELQAHAFTHGNDIYFNSGKYNPENSDGKFLLAHELTHVVQQDDKSGKIQRDSLTDDDIDIEASEMSMLDDDTDVENSDQNDNQEDDMIQTLAENGGLIQRDCAGNCPQTKQKTVIRGDCSSGNPLDANLYIASIDVDISAQTVTITWSDANATQEQFSCSPNKRITPTGNDLVGVKCSIKHTNKKKDGMAWFTGFQSQGLRIGFHDSQRVGKGIKSHGCVRVCCDAAKKINQNTWSGVTTINVK